MRKKLKIQYQRMKKSTILFIVIFFAINPVFSQLKQGSPFESWSNSISFDQFNDDHIKIIGSSDFEPWTNSYRFIHFFDESFSLPAATPEVETPVVNAEKPDTLKIIEANLSAKDAQASVDEGFVSPKINIYPNPATEKINVNINLASNSDVEITLFNSIGNIVYSTLIKEKRQILKIIDVETVNKGIYFLEIKSEGKKTIKKIIIK